MKTLLATTAVVAALAGGASAATVTVLEGTSSGNFNYVPAQSRIQATGSSTVSVLQPLDADGEYAIQFTLNVDPNGPLGTSTYADTVSLGAFNLADVLDIAPDSGTSGTIDVAGQASVKYSDLVEAGDTYTANTQLRLSSSVTDFVLAGLGFGEDSTITGDYDLDYAVVTEAATVPLPATLPLGALAIGGLAFVARRRKSG